MTLHASGIRDISQVSGLCSSSVVDILRREAKKIKEPCFEGHFEDVEVDEFWSFVDQRTKQNDGVGMPSPDKSEKFWPFISANGTKALVKPCIENSKTCPLDGQYYTDDYKTYSKVLPPEQHTIGKEHTTHIERLNRDFRTHLKRLTRRTVCHSRKDEMHYSIMKMYINRRNSV